MPFYLLQIVEASAGGPKIMVTASGFPELRLFVDDEDDALSAGREAIRQALHQRRLAGSPLPEPLADRPHGGLVVEVLDDWLMEDSSRNEDLTKLDGR